MVRIKEDKFEKLLAKASQKANELSFKKLVLKSLRIDVKTKDKKEIGLIAEELAEIFPELVENDENGNPTSVNYTRAVTVLFDGFKQMYKELKEIKEKIK